MNNILLTKVEKEAKEQEELMKIIDNAWKRELNEKKHILKIWKMIFSKGHIKIKNNFGEFQLGLNFQKNQITKKFEYGGTIVEVFSNEDNLKEVLNCYEEHKERIKRIENSYIYM